MEAYALGVSHAVLFYITETSWWVLLAQGVTLFISYVALNALELLIETRFISRHNMSFSSFADSTSSILIAGDSTAVGTGATDPKHTVAGLLSRDFPHTGIVNVARNGSCVKSVVNQLECVGDNTFNIIIISTGGNDVWALTQLKKLRTDLCTVLNKAKQMSNHRVVLLFFGNEGSAPFFPFLIRGLLMRRTEQVKDLFKKVAHDEQVPLLELFSDPKQNPFVKDPKRMFARDGLHPSDAGYWEWYKHLWRLMSERGYHYKEESHLRYHP